MTPNRLAMIRSLLLSALALLPALVLMATAQEAAAAMGAAIAVAVIATVAVGAHQVAPGWASLPLGATPGERRLRGAFDRHSHPDAPGRARPRAPGNLR